MEKYLGSTILTLNNWIAFCLGIIFNLVLIWLLLKRTPKEMDVHRKILLQTYFLDVFLLVATVLVQPVKNFLLIHSFVSKKITFNASNKLYIFFNGPLSSLITGDNLPAKLYILFMTWYTIYMFETLAICVQFIYRYLLLNR